MDNNETNCLESEMGIQHPECNCTLCKLNRKNSDSKPKAKEDEDGS